MNASVRDRGWECRDVASVAAVARAAAAPSSRRMSELPPEERPRERLARHGAGALSDRELLGLLIGTGRRGESALDVADRVLGGGLRELAGRGLWQLEREAGLGRAKASRLVAALELGSRLAADTGGARVALSDPEAVARYLSPRYASRPVETFGLLALDVRHRLRREVVISVGCLTASLVHPREVFQAALEARAAGILVFHNHPSGDPEPSAEDVALTRRLAAAGSLMGVELLDHLVLGAGRHVSLKSRGLL